MKHPINALLEAPQRVFLITSLLIGTILIFYILPRGSPDESVHFLRAAELSQGYLLSRSHLPEDIVNFADPRKNYLNIQSYIQDNSKLPYNRGIIYSPTVYLSSLPAFWLGLELGWSPLTILYAARMMTLLASTLLLYAAVRITPFLKWQFTLLSLFPTALMLRSAISADPLTMAYIFVFTALIFNYIAFNTTISVIKIGILALLATLICLSKTVYIMLPWLVLLIPKSRYPSKAYYFSTVLAAIILPVMLGLFWSYSVQQLFTEYPFPSVDSLVNNMMWAKPANTSEVDQVAFILQHPFSFAGTLLITLIAEFWLYIHQMVLLNGTQLIAPLTMGLVTLLFLMKDGVPTAIYPDVTCHKRAVAWVIILLIATVVILCASLYASWTPVGFGIIFGIQGRYFLPLMPLLLFVLAKPGHTAQSSKCLIYSIIIITLLVIYSFIEIYRIYYL